MRAAISSGYTKGFHTIVDANVVTLITAGVLFMAGTGSVKGFAFTLAVGVLVSMFTAVLATRAMLGVLSGFKWFNNAALMGASGPEGALARRHHRPQVPLVRDLRRRWC